MTGGRRQPRRNAAAAQRPLRVLIASHSHPEVTSGGAEIAAFELYKRMNERSDFESWFLGCSRAGHGHIGAVLMQPFSDREYIYQCGEFEWFNFANRDPRFPEELTRLLLKLRPDVIHLHHYINFGVEVFLHIRRVLPRCSILVTLHEYLAICNHYGQMITTNTYGLCYNSSPMRCQKCFPHLSSADFYLRKQYIKRFFDLVDAFISPSRFLAERYAAWGIAHERITVIENVLRSNMPSRLPERRAGRDTLRVGFFGQISLLKGINVLLDAAEMLERQGCLKVAFEVFGDDRAQPEEFQRKFRERLTKLPGNVHFHGPYERERVGQLMQTVDVVLVPSVWWENSPLVIQEAFRAERPLICSDIGGMAEKVADGVNGFLFPAGSAIELANLLRLLADEPERLRAVEQVVAEQRFDDAAMQAHFDLYSKALPRGMTAAPAYA